MSEKTKPTSINLSEEERAFLDALLSGSLKAKHSKHAVLLALVRTGMRAVAENPKRIYEDLGGAPLPAPPVI